MAMSKTGRYGLAALPLVVVPVGFLLSGPWLKATFGGTATMLTAAVAAIFVMAYALYLSVRCQRDLDEVQAAGGTFAARWGMTIGPIIFATLLLLPPFHDMMTAIIGDAAGVPANRKVVTLAMTFGFGAVVILQTIAMVILNLLWWRARR
jgi:hypothetical protein